MRGIYMEYNYSKAILELRSKLNISQHELANILGVSFQSVNRWENGHFEPTKIVKVRVDKMLKDNGIVLDEVNE
ncbi:MAG: helix-turn-helix transcriptional regulator [Bacilli bacterium]|nr:helix-turn-helix transcriptional regulator [Bacilli bacterium]